uniref:Transposase (putative) gypsy type domain-containing protein n=1 Tax=Fagus sylvatica TaxID=28930 RepID=A0A2N9F591_FAGSY
MVSTKYLLYKIRLSQRGVLRRSRATGGSDWSAVLSEELPEGLSSSGRESEGTFFETTTSTRVVSRLPVVPKHLAVYSYFSKFNEESLGRIRSRYQVSEDVVLRIPNSDEQACSHAEDVALYESTLTAGLRFPVQPFIRELLDFLSLAPGQVAPNRWRVIISFMVMWKESNDGLDDITVEEFLYCFEPSQIAASPSFWTFRNRDNLVKLVEGLPSFNRGWKNGYFFVCGDNSERLPEESDDFIRIQRTWGIPSPSALNRPTFTPVWKDRILRVHSLFNRQYTHYIQPELLFRHSFGPEPNATILSLIQTNEKRKATMKINKSKLKKKILDEEIAVVQATDDGPTICRSHGLVAKRAEAAITELDFQEYANARTKNISKLMVHSLIRAVFELNKEKRGLIAAVEAVKVDLIAKEGDVKAAVEARDEAMKEMKHLMGQVEGVRAAAVLDYKASEAFEDNNLQCFYSGFEAFRKQAKEKYPNVDFIEFQPYDNTNSMNDDGGRGAEGNQTDDATT